MAANAASHPPAGQRQGIFASTITLGRVAGVPIGINWTWLAVFGLFVWSLAGVEFPAALPGRSTAVYTAMGLAAAIVFFGSLILHELGHALQAGREGVRIEGITLWLFGGVAKIAGEFPSAGAELRIAVAGPLVTLALGIAFGAAAAATGSGVVHEVLLWLCFVNATLLVFNLVPAMPLDGGRVLRASLWARSGDRVAATHRATRIGALLAGTMIALGVLEAMAGQYGGIWLAVIGWFILEAGQSEDRYVGTHEALKDVTVGGLMTADPVTVEAGTSLADFVAHVAGTARHGAYPVLSDGRFVGMLPLSALAHHPPSQWGSVVVAECMVPSGALLALTPGTPAGEALDMLVSGGAGRAVVLKGDRLVGIVSVTDLARALAVGRPV